MTVMFSRLIRMIKSTRLSISRRLAILSSSRIYGLKSRCFLSQNPVSLWLHGFFQRVICGIPNLITDATHTFSQKKKRIRITSSGIERGSFSRTSRVSCGPTNSIQKSTSAIVRSLSSRLIQASKGFQRAVIKSGLECRQDYSAMNQPFNQSLRML